MQRAYFHQDCIYCLCCYFQAFFGISWKPLARVTFPKPLPYGCLPTILVPEHIHASFLESCSDCFAVDLFNGFAVNYRCEYRDEVDYGKDDSTSEDGKGQDDYQVEEKTAYVNIKHGPLQNIQPENNLRRPIKNALIGSPIIIKRKCKDDQL